MVSFVKIFFQKTRNTKVFIEFKNFTLFIFNIYQKKR